MMPMRSFGRPSMNLRVTSRIASTRVACSPPIVKSLISIEPETSSTIMMSIPLASTCVRLLPSRGRASATMKMARLRKSSARRILPARAALDLPSPRRTVVEEKTSAAAGPRWPSKIGEQRKREQEQQQPRIGEGERRVLGPPVKQVQAGLLSRSASLLRAATRCRLWSPRSARI